MLKIVPSAEQEFTKPYWKEIKKVKFLWKKEVMARWLNQVIQVHIYSFMKEVNWIQKKNVKEIIYDM